MGMNFGQLMKARERELGFSQSDVCKLVGINQSMYYKYRKSGLFPKLHVFLKISEGLELGFKEDDYKKVQYESHHSLLELPKPPAFVPTVTLVKHKEEPAVPPLEETVDAVEEVEEEVIITEAEEKEKTAMPNVSIAKRDVKVVYLEDLENGSVVESGALGTLIMGGYNIVNVTSFDGCHFVTLVRETA